MASIDTGSEAFIVPRGVARALNAYFGYTHKVNGRIKVRCAAGQTNVKVSLKFPHLQLWIPLSKFIIGVRFCNKDGKLVQYCGLFD